MIVFRFLRTVLGWAWILTDTMLCAVRIGFHGESEASERVLQGWARRFLRVTGARVVAARHVQLDRERSYVFVSNHTSNLDVAAIISVLGHPLRFIAKQELKRIPLFGWAATRMGHVFIDRKDRGGAAKVVQGRIERSLSGASLFFFAEGTRAVADELLPFKKGAAVAAIELGLDSIPIAVAGARTVLKPKGFALFQPGPVAVVVGAPIPAAGHTMERRDDLVAAQRAAVGHALDEARALLAGAGAATRSGAGPAAGTGAGAPPTERAGSGT
ncbi:MAG TPA: lysophospholipid acyltransferase family protein [Myxococcales bacterium]|nr:lysophospholipid acyltransferase family protein [Myxococcales bacterium]